MSRPAINRGNLIWSGEHWVNYLREPGAQSDSGMVSLYHTRYSPAGEGTVAFVDIASDFGLSAVCTDNRQLAEYITQTMIRGRGNPFDRDLPVLDAEFARSGDVRQSPSWIIRTQRDHIVATWVTNQPAIVAEGFAPFFREGIDIFTILFFVDEATLVLNGKPVAGRPYLRDIWRKSIGGDRSSCVFALAETIIGLPSSG
jgi:hypothetical protein